MKKIFLLLPLFAAMLLSCTKEVSPEISTSVFSQQTDSDGCVFSVDVKSNAPWSAAADYSDVTITPESGIGNGTVSVSVPQYVGRETKLVKVTFTASSDTKTAKKAYVVITQESLPFLFCEENAKTVAAEATSVTFQVNSNYKWTMKDCEAEDFEDLDIDPVTNDGSAIDVVLNFPENTTGKDRTAKIYLQLADYPQVTETLTLTQQK